MRAKYGRGSRRFTRCSPIDTVRLEILSSSTARLMVSNSISVSCDSSIPTKSYWRSSATVFFSSCACRWRSTSSASICSFIRASFPYCSVRCACSSLKILSSFILYLLLKSMFCRPMLPALHRHVARDTTAGEIALSGSLYRLRLCVRARERVLHMHAGLLSQFIKLFMHRSARTRSSCACWPRTAPCRGRRRFPSEASRRWLHWPPRGSCPSRP